jgi:hypothetical protein
MEEAWKVAHMKSGKSLLEFLRTVTLATLLAVAGGGVLGCEPGVGVQADDGIAGDGVAPDLAGGLIRGGESCDDGVDDDGDGLIDCEDPDCEGAPECVALEGPIAKACGDDAYEQNDSAAGARGIALPAQLQGVICPNDADWYAFSVAGGCRIQVNLAFSHAQGDLNLQLFGPTGSQLAAAYSTTDNESVAALAPSTGTYRVHVYGFKGAGNRYALGVTTSCGASVTENCTNGVDDDHDGLVDCADPDCASALACVPPENCTNGIDDDRDGLADCADPDCAAAPACAPLACPADDVHEQNDSQAAGRLIGPGAHRGIVCAHDADWFALDLAAGCTVQADLRFSHATGNLHLQLRTPAGATLAASYSNTDDERVQATVTTAGRYALHIYGHQGASAPWDLLVGVTCDTPLPPPPPPPVENCTNGVDDDGDGRTDCADSDCAGAPACLPPENCTNGVDDDRDGKTDCADSDCADAPACLPPENCTNGVDDDRDGKTDCADPDCAGASACAAPPPPATLSCPADDAFEQNDSPATARDIGAGGTFRGIVCPHDSDWFAISANAGCQIRADLRFRHATGNLHMQLRTSSGTQLAAAYSSTDDELIQVTAPSSGVFHLHVYGFQGASAPYDLVVAVTCAGGTAPEVCNNGIDDDGDGRVDCSDPDCVGIGACGATPTEACTGGIDEDGDGLTDCADPDCAQHLACRGPVEYCTNGVDDDGDGLVDCADSDCSGALACRQPELNCSNGMDDDGDGLVDCADPDCAGSTGCAQACTAAGTIACGQTVSGTTAGRTSAIGTSTCGLYEVTGPEMIYSFTAQQAGAVTFRLSGLTADLDLFVLEGSCSSDRCIGYSATIDQELVVVDVVAGRTYYVVVDGFLGASGSFTLNAACSGTPVENCTNGRDDDGDGLVDCADSACAGTSGCTTGDDVYEDNDDATTATTGVTQASGLRVRGGDDDWFAVDVCDRGTVTVTVTFNHGVGDIDLVLLDTTLNELSASFSVTNTETVSWTNRTGTTRTVFAVVLSFLGVSNTYDLRITISGC